MFSFLQLCLYSGIIKRIVGGTTVTGYSRLDRGLKALVGTIAACYWDTVGLESLDYG